MPSGYLQIYVRLGNILRVSISIEVYSVTFLLSWMLEVIRPPCLKYFWFITRHRNIYSTTLETTLLSFRRQQTCLWFKTKKEHYLTVPDLKTHHYRKTQLSEWELERLSFRPAAHLLLWTQNVKGINNFGKVKWEICKHPKPLQWRKK